MTRVPDRVVGRVFVSAAFLHSGAARRLVHQVKYSGSRPATDVLAEAMVSLARGAAAIVPIPRVAARRWRYGVDGGRLLAIALTRRLAVPMVDALIAPLIAPSNTGAGREERTPPRFTQRYPVPPGSVLVDDVVTTGQTVNAAATVLGGLVERAVCATTVPEVTSLRSTSQPGGT